jgi:hypothetical protein
LNINNIVIQNTLIVNDEFFNFSIFSNETSEKDNEPKTYCKWKDEHNNELCHLMAIHKHISLKKIAKMFYTSNVHPMLNTQKIHDQLKRLQKSQKIQTKTKLQKELNHMTNQTSYITNNKKICVNETLVSNSDMCNFFTTNKVDSTICKKSLKKFIKKLCMHAHLKFETKNVIECKNKLKYSPIYEFVGL